LNIISVCGRDKLFSVVIDGTKAFQLKFHSQLWASQTFVICVHYNGRCFWMKPICAAQESLE